MTAEELRRRGAAPPGSRCDRIMQAIDAGMSDKDIAKRYGTSAKVIAVYRAWHDGNLAQAKNDMPTDRGRPGAQDGGKPKYETAWEMRALGWSYKRIAEAMGKSEHAARNLVYRYGEVHGLKGDPVNQRK